MLWHLSLVTVDCAIIAVGTILGLHNSNHDSQNMLMHCHEYNYEYYGSLFAQCIRMIELLIYLACGVYN